MADDADLQKELYKVIDKERTGMLGLTSKPDEHFQPMTAQVEDGSKTIWFFGRKDSDLAQEAASGQPAMFTIQTDKFWACVGGQLSAVVDRAHIDKFWNPFAAAWYPNGKDDPNLTMFKLEPDSAQVWTQPGGEARYLFQVAKAMATKTLPDAGDQATLKL